MNGFNPYGLGSPEADGQGIRQDDPDLVAYG